MYIKDSKGGKNHKIFNFSKYISCKKIKIGKEEPPGIIKGTW
jgi:hypothetical protein